MNRSVAKIATLALATTFGMGLLVAPAASAATPLKYVTPEQFGANGFDNKDDTAALKAAIDSMNTGDTLRLRSGARYQHNDVLRIDAGGRVLGYGSHLVATNPERSAVWLDAGNLDVRGVTFHAQNVTKRYSTWEQMKVRLMKHDNISLTDVKINGAAAAGVYVGGTTNFTLRNLQVSDSKADGIHLTDGARNGQVIFPKVYRSGDDGVAVVSYRGNNNSTPPVENIKVTSPRVYDNVWGRGVSVVGGKNITYTDVYSKNSATAAVYVASEGNWNTYPSEGVVIDKARIEGANKNSQVDHGAVLVYDGSPGVGVKNVTLKNFTIVDTRSTASRNVGVLNEVERVSLENFRVDRGPKHLLTVNGDKRNVRTLGWKQNNVSIADQRNF